MKKYLYGYHGQPAKMYTLPANRVGCMLLWGWSPPRLLMVIPVAELPVVWLLSTWSAAVSVLKALSVFWSPDWLTYEWVCPGSVIV